MDEQLATAAKKEFETFVKWYNEKLGAHPIIIGGWAVNHYNDYFGSKDVDVIFEAKRKFYDTPLTQFLAANGYRLDPRDDFTETFKKEIRAGKQTAEIDIDAADIGRANQFHANNKKNLSYSLCAKHCIEISEKTGGTTLTYRVPRLELLIAYKIKAYHDRNFELTQPENTRLNQYYTSKRDKDGSDIIALLDSKNTKNHARVSHAYLNALMQQHNMKKEAKEVLNMISERPGSRDLYKKIDDKKRVALVADLLSKIA